MKPSDFDASPREQQIAMSMLAHAARHDSFAVTASLTLIADPSEGLRPAQVIAALLGQFEIGMTDEGCEELANWYAAEAQELARKTAA